MRYKAELDLARRVATIAGHNALRIRTTNVSREVKADGSLITSADRENEHLIREAIGTEYPDDAIIGEEEIPKAGKSGRRWIIDPLDGTYDYARQSRFWSVLIALEEQSEIVVGVAHFPMLEETYWGVRGLGAYRNDIRIHVSNTADIGGALISASGLHGSALTAHPHELMDFMCRFNSIRNPGGALSAVMLAAGQVDVWLKGEAQIWDVAALQVIIEEAGGRYFAFDGSRRTDLGNAVACTPQLEQDVREFLAMIHQ